MTSAGLASMSAAALLVANLGTLGVVGAPPRMSTSSELRFVMKSGATPAPTPRSRRCLRTRLTRDGQQALRRCRSHSPSGHQSEPADLFPDGRPTRADRARSGAAPICEGRSSASTEEQGSRRRGARALTFASLGCGVGSARRPPNERTACDPPGIAPAVPFRERAFVCRIAADPRRGARWLARVRGCPVRRETSVTVVLG